MNCPKLDELPLIKSKKGWPWTEESSSVSTPEINEYLWPKVSIVTVSFNQGQFLEESIRSVLLQGYPNLEYIIIDGGSTDNSIDIIKKYEPWLHTWVSEKDSGQSHAINKGLQRSTGEYWAWLNSDDIYMQGFIFRGIKVLRENLKVAMVYGDGLWINEDSKPLSTIRSGPLDAQALLTGVGGHGIPQATSLMRREAVELVGGVNEKLHMAMDFDLWIKLSLHYNLEYLTEAPIAGIRSHLGMKTRNYQLQAYLEDLEVLKKYFNDPLCPNGVSPFKNLEYISCNFGVARGYIEKNMPLKALHYILKAIKADYFYTTKRLFKAFKRIMSSKIKKNDEQH